MLQFSYQLHNFLLRGFGLLFINLGGDMPHVLYLPVVADVAELSECATLTSVTL
jgi:hypothetical protein